MATGEGTRGTRRIQFSLPAALVDAIDEYCARLLMSRSTFVEYTLAQAISTQQDFISKMAEGTALALAAEAVASADSKSE